MFNKIKAYFKYYKRIKKYEKELKEKFNIHIDWIGRLYTILITEKDYSDEMEIQNDKMFFEFVNSFYKGWLIENKFYEITPELVEKKDNRMFLLVFSNERFNVKRWINNILYFILFSIIIITTLIIYL